MESQTFWRNLCSLGSQRAGVTNGEIDTSSKQFSPPECFIGSSENTKWFVELRNDKVGRKNRSFSPRSESVERQRDKQTES